MAFVNLYPDMSRSQYTKNDTFIYAAPVGPEVWDGLRALARFTPDNVPYLGNDQAEGLEDIVIILRSPTMTDDDCLTAQAYIRLVDNVTNRIYCVPCVHSLSMASLINKTAGAPRELCKMLTVELTPRKELADI